MKGFTFLELMIVVAMLAILSVVGIGYYRNFSRNVELEENAKVIVSELRNARAKAMAGESGMKWGIHFVHSSSSQYYYQLFSTPSNFSHASTTIASTNYLTGPIEFSTPSASSTLDVIFNRISGTATSSSVTVTFEGNNKTIIITSNGNVY